MFRFTRPGRRLESNKQNAHIENNVSITPVPATVYEAITITYDGPLSQNGATETIYAHIGDGQWQKTQDIPMDKDGRMWMTDIIPTDLQMNFCFHDGQGNWDNNLGQNWNFIVHDT